MKRLMIGLAVVSAMAMVDSAWTKPERAELDAQTEQPLRLELILVDGSRVIGTPSIEKVPVETSYAKMDVPLKQLVSITLGDDHETASIVLQNGDKLKGVITLEPIRLDTIFGAVKIGTEHLRSLRVLKPGGTLPATLRDGLTLFYSFDVDEAGQVSDGSGLRNDGKVQGARWVPDGVQGGAYRFAGGADLITTAIKPFHTMTVSDDRSFALWWKATGSLQHKTLLNELDGKGQGFALMVLPEGYYVPSIVHQYGKFATPFADGQWHHVVLVKKGTAWRLFHDGLERALSDSRNWPVGQDLVCMTGIQIGNTPGSQDTGFAGEIDEVMVYQRALSDDEVKQLYAAQKG